MVEYNVSIDHKSGNFIIQSDNIMAGSVPVNIPDTDKSRKHFISLFLHKADIELGLDYLMCISADKHSSVNQALFVSALACMMKCFQDTSACTMLSEDGFKKYAPNEAVEYEKYKAWRNKHYIHDENSMREAIAFLLIAPDTSSELFGGPPSVIWNSVSVNYVAESRQLERVMQSLWSFTCKEIDKAADALLKKYNSETKQTLLSFGPAKMRGATSKLPAATRDLSQS